MELGEVLSDVENASWWKHQGNTYRSPLRDSDGRNAVIFKNSRGELTCVSFHGSVDSNIYHLDEHGCLLGSVCAAPGAWYRSGFTVEVSKHERFMGQVLQLKFDADSFFKVALGSWSAYGCQTYRGELFIPDSPGRDPRTVPCRYFMCGAKINEPCHTRLGRTMSDYHKKRQDDVLAMSA
jgi:hypothetical protein